MRKYQTIAELIKTEYPNAKDISGNIDASIEHGYNIHIYPYIKWTDGGYKPCYSGGWNSIENNVRFYVFAERGIQNV